MDDPCPLLGYAYELQAGDVVAGRTVESVDDPDRPDNPPLWAKDDDGKDCHGPATVHFTDGDPEEMDRLTEVALTRDRSQIHVWNGPPGGTEET